MSDRVDRTATDAGVTTGRPLDDGRPDGPALELGPGGIAVDLLRQSPRPLASSPGAGTWATLLERPAEGETDRPVLLQLLDPDATAVPTHHHPTSERFTVLSGTLTVVTGGEERRLGAGEVVEVPPGVEHTFRNDTDETVAFRAELPSMRTVESLYTVPGLDHEGALGGDGEYGEPDPLTGLVVSADAYSDTVTTVVPVAVQRVLWATVGRLARTLGYGGVDDRYLDDAFRERRVEQPDLG